MRLISVALMVMTAISLPATAQTLTPLPPHPDGVAWPTDGWEEGDLPASIADAVTAIADEAMAREVGDVTGETRALVIIHEGKLVLERYADGFGPETKQVSWSMAKSITSALVGRAVELGLVEDIDALMPSPFEEDDPRADITWRQWLTMTDGLDYEEIQAETMAENDVIQMMYGPGRHDVIQYVVSELEPAHAPGTHWNYSTAGFHLLSRALDELWRQTDGSLRAEVLAPLLGELGSLNELPGDVVDDLYWLEVDGPAILFGTSEFFGRLGMDAQPEFDAAGTYLGGSLVWASARDFAKFGYLYLRDGIWEGERLLPEGWVDFSRTGAAEDDGNVYGAGFWITTGGVDPIPAYQLRTSPPWDSFAAEGHEGQTIFIVPSRDLVIVRLGLMPNGGDNWPELFRWNQALASLFPEIDSDG